MVNKTIDEKIADVCQQITFGLTLAPEGDFGFRIKRLIDELPKPDILIAKDKSGETVYSNHPELLGCIIIVDDATYTSNTLIEMNAPVKKVTGDPGVWLEQLFTNQGMKTFLETFIEKNT